MDKKKITSTIPLKTSERTKLLEMRLELVLGRLGAQAADEDFGFVLLHHGEGATPRGPRVVAGG